MTESDFHRIVLALLLTWGALGTALLLTPSRALRLLTRGRVTVSGRAAAVARILGAVNAYGAFHIFWFGR